MAVLAGTVQDRGHLRGHLLAGMKSLRLINHWVGSGGPHELQTNKHHHHSQDDPFENLKRSFQARNLRRRTQISAINENKPIVMNARVYLTRAP